MMIYDESIIINNSDMIKNFEYYCDKVTDDKKTVIVRLKNDRNVVIISLEEYNNMLENLLKAKNND